MKLSWVTKVSKTVRRFNMQEKSVGLTWITAKRISLISVPNPCRIFFPFSSTRSGGRHGSADHKGANYPSLNIRPL